MKNRFIAVVSGACVGLGIFWLLKDFSSKPSGMTPQASVVAQPTPVAAPVLEKKKITLGKIKPHNVDSTEPTPSDIVSFEIKDGFGIVQNDIIIGTPEEGTEKTGFYKLPIPNYWDKPEIPYAIDVDAPRPEEIEKALKHIEEKTGLKFIPYDNQPDAILFQKGKEHCLSALGRLGGVQPIRLSDSCGWHEITHEVMHALGFIHEHSRFDRNDYIAVEWQNIEEKYHMQFEIFAEDLAGPAKHSPFDYHSIMLYEKNFFAKDKGLTTLKSKTNQLVSPGRGLSALDIDRVKKLFRLD